MKLLRKVKQLRHRLYIWHYSHMPIEENKIILWANSFKHFGCNPKYIALYLLKHYPGKYDLVWVFHEDAEIPEELPSEIRVVRYFSMEYLKELHTAKFVICNMRTSPAYMWHKRQEQVYIQTWHSSLRLKMIEGDAACSLGEKYIQAAQEDSEKIDLLISGCDFSTEIFKRAFWYHGEILKSGTPRCDCFFSEKRELRKKVFSRYGIPESRKLVLYAPTFRKSKDANIFGMDFKRLTESLNALDGGEWVAGYRLHPNILERCAAEDGISMSDYSDMQELISSADLLITDYSSCMFDMAIAGKPCILYVPDLESYMENERGLYFDIERLPFPLAHDMDALCSVAATFDAEKYHTALKKFISQIGSYENGTAAQQVAEYIESRRKK